MPDFPIYEPPIAEELYAKALGWELLKFARAYNEHALARRLDTAAISILRKIQAVLNDDTLDDPECFYRIEAIVEAFHEGGLSTSRHDF